MSDKLLQQAIVLIRAGEKQKGGQILANILKVDPRNESAWLWMSQAVNTRQQQRHCLERVLAINPGNEIAQKALAKIEHAQKSPVQKRSQVRPQPAPPMTPTQRNRILLIAGGWLLVLTVVFVGGYLWLQKEKFREDFDPLIDVCWGKRINEAATYSPASDKHPAVGVRASSGGGQLDMQFIPREVRPQSLAETQLVLCMGKVEEVFIESCPYIFPDDPTLGTKTVERYYYKQEAKLIAAKTGQVISTERFTGKSARHCDETEWFSEGVQVIKLRGTAISDDVVRRWVRSQLIVE